MANKYITLTGLQEFLTQLKGAYSGTTAGFDVNVAHIAAATTTTNGLLTAADKTKLNGIATGATKVEDSTTNGNILVTGSAGTAAEVNVYTHPAYTETASGFYKVAVDALGHVSGTTAVVKSDLSSLIGSATTSNEGLMTTAQVNKLGGIAAGAQVNVLEGISFKGNGDAEFSDLTITDKKAILDISGYALKTEIASALNFKGTATGADLRAMTAADVANGDVYSCTSDDSTGTPVFHEGYEYAVVKSGDPATITWTELGNYIDLSGYVQKTQKVNGKALSGDITLNGADIALTGYSKAETASAIAATDTVNAAVGKLEKKVDDNASDITTLNGADTVTGSVAQKIKSAIEDLDGTQTAGYYVTSVTEANGVVTSTREAKGTVASGITALVDGGAVYSAITSAVNALDVGAVGGSGSYISAISEANGKISATVGTKGSIAANNANLVDGGTVYAVTSTKADKVSNATSGNFAGLDANGNLTDSGKKAADFVEYAQGAANEGKILQVNASGSLALTDLSDIGITSVTGTSPVTATTSNGAVTVALADSYGDTKNPYGAKTANTVLAGPTSGDSASPSFRALVEADIPGDMAVSKIKFGASAFTSGHVVGVDASGHIVDSGIAYADIDNDLNSITMNGKTVTITSKNAALAITSADSDAIAVTTSDAGAVSLSLATATDAEIDTLFTA